MTRRRKPLNNSHSSRHGGAFQPVAEARGDWTAWGSRSLISAAKPVLVPRGASAEPTSAAIGQAPVNGAAVEGVQPLRWKRCLDLLLILLSLPLLLPVMLLTALAIKLVSPGPAFFVQRRIGYGRRTFPCFKFRTMAASADVARHVDLLTALVASGEPLRKLDRNDSRIIPLGRWIRAAGIDELPQIWNIVRGEMSLVGPRPCADYELGCFEGEALERFRALPGLTGLWQISGKNDTTFAEMVRHDLLYVRNCSVGLDIKIMANTPYVVLSQVLGLTRDSARRDAGANEELGSMKQRRPAPHRAMTRAELP